MNRYFQVFENIGTGIFILNPEFKVQYWNVCLEDWTNISNSEIQGSDIWDYFPNFKQETLKNRIQSVFNDGMPVVLSSSLNKDLLVPEGHDLIKRKTYEISVTLLDSVPEDPSVYTLVTVNNVTELTRKLEDVKELNKLANEEIVNRKKAEQRLKESDVRLKQIFKTSQVGIVLTQNRTMNFVNHYLCELIGYNEAELVGKNARILYPSEEEYESLGARKFPKLMKSGSASEETLFKAKNGEIINVLMNSSFFNGKNDEDGVISVITDISYLKEVETTMYESQKKLIQKNKEKDTFITIMSHDLMSLIGGSTQFLELLELDDPEIVDYKQLTHQISQNTKAAFELLKDLISWGKASLGQISFTPAKLQLKECLRKVVNTYSTHVSDKEIEVTISCNMSDQVYADANMLEAILRNLLKNAIKYTEKGGCIQVNGTQNDSSTTICVSDSGMGMSKGQVKKLFSMDAIESMLGTSGEKGSGLGLRIIKEYINRHQATIDITSEKGKGTSFTIHFPQATTVV